MMDIYQEYANSLHADTPSSPREKKAWLLTWNPSGFEWSDYTQAVENVRSGDGYSIDWTCVSKHVNIGDRVFLIMLGTPHNGIVASGFVTKAPYEADHWDEERAAQGSKRRYIGISFDKLLNYTTEPILPQKTLQEQFPNQHWSPQGSGIEIKNEYIDALEQLWASVAGGEEKLSTKETIDIIKSYIVAKGFSYEDGLVENFYLSLNSKPFVILAGTSGTGKTRLVKLFAEAIGATTANGRYQMVAVRPDWSDSSDLFGHVDLNGNFIPGAIIDFIKRAELDSIHPYILCLDEMNLARVEYYFSDVLSIMETRDFDSGRIVSDPLVPSTYYGSDVTAAGKYGTVRLPDNLYIIGTVNMDETTFPFSRKVLDRANTIEFSRVGLIPQTVPKEPVAPLTVGNDFLVTKYLLLQ